MEGKKGMSSTAKVVITVVILVVILVGIMFIVSQLSDGEGGSNFHEQFRNSHN